jgi:hypothetical protein
MTALSQTMNPTLLDLARRLNPDGSVATDIIELMTPINEVLEDMTWLEGNLPTGHKSTIRTGLPTATWRKLYGGVQPSKSTTTQVVDTTGMLEAWAEVDKALADLNGNTASFRLSEEMAQLAAMNLAIAQGIFYQNETTQAESFTGLTPRYNSLSANNAENIIAADGAGTDNASIWLTFWGPNTVHGIVPKGSPGGLQRKDYGEVVIEDVTGAAGGSNGGGRMVAYRTHYRWDAGLVLKDWRSCVRICNIDKSNLTKTGSTGSDLPDLMFQALETVPAVCQAGARPAFYMSRTVLSYLRRQVANKTSGSTLEIADVGGKKVMMFQGVPLRRCDALAADEALVS